MVILSLIVGFGDVFQQTPRADIESPPSEMTVPQEIAPVPVIPPTDDVVTVGGSAVVVKTTSLP